MMLPKTPRKRRLGWLLVWTLLAFVGGVLAGPALTGHAVGLVERACAMVGMSPPRFVTNFRPAAPARPSVDLSAPTPAPGVEKAPAGEEKIAAPVAATEPVAAQVEQPAEPEKPVGAVAAPAPPAAPEATEVAEVAVADKPGAHAAHVKNEAKSGPAKVTPARTATGAHASAREGAKSDNPFDEGGERASESKATALRKPKPAFDEPAAPKPTAATSHDSLDNLMADVASDKDKKRGSKTIDALLKDVQKSNAEPTKHEAAAPAPPLSQADITRVMAGVKIRGKDCAQRLAQAGIAELKIVVGKEGNVTSASVGGKLANTPVGACIEKVMRASSFPRSTGLRFDYRLDVR